MLHIVVDDERARIISQSPESIEVRDRTGRHLGYVTGGFTDEDVAIARQRMASDEPRYTTEQVLEHLQSLEQK